MWLYHYYFIVLIILGVYEIFRKKYKKIYFRNKTILDQIPDLLRSEQYDKILDEIKVIESIPSQLSEKKYWRALANTYKKESISAIQDFNSIKKEYCNFPDYNYHKGGTYWHRRVWYCIRIIK